MKPKCKTCGTEYVPAKDYDENGDWSGAMIQNCSCQVTDYEEAFLAEHQACVDALSALEDSKDECEKLKARIEILNSIIESAVIFQFKPARSEA